MSSLPDAVANFEAERIRNTLKTTKGNVKDVVKILNIPRRSLYNKFTRYNINPDDYRRTRTDSSCWKGYETT